MFMLEQMGDRTFLKESCSASSFLLIGDVSVEPVSFVSSAFASAPRESPKLKLEISIITK